MKLGHWKKSEKKIVKRIGGRPTPASGAMWWSKGDGNLDGWRVEVKGTQKDTFRITESILNRLHKDAGGKDPMLVVHFKDHSNRLYFVVPEFAGEGLEAGEGTNTVEPYSPTFWFMSKLGVKFFVMPEAVAKIRLSLANSK